MNKEYKLENYLSISPNKLGIYLFDTTNLKNLYKKELVIKENIKYLDFDILKKFLDNNIFEIEKFSGKFVKNIFIIIEYKKILNLEIGIKKKNYTMNNETFHYKVRPIDAIFFSFHTTTLLSKNFWKKKENSSNSFFSWTRIE